MKILYDHQIFTTQNYGGISRYFYELMREFSGMQDINYEIPLLVSNNHYISDKRLLNHIDLFPRKHFRGKQRLFKLFNKPNTILRLKQQNFDVFHPTYYDTYFLKYLGKKPFVLTVYDMIHEKFPQYFGVKDNTSSAKRILAEKASRIIAISENTKKDIVKLYNINEKKIEVIYLGNSLNLYKIVTADKSLPRRYLLYIGDRHIYKNFNNFIHAIKRIIDKDKELKVICGGGKKFNNVELKLFKDCGIEENIIHYPIKDDDSLACLYTNAIAFICPSLYEGFGIPILEAFSCGCPVVLSDTSSFPEVAGDAGLYFNPNSVESIIEAIKKIVTDKLLRESLKTRGFNRLKDFSWKKTAIETLEVYQAVLEQRINNV